MKLSHTGHCPCWSIGPDWKTNWTCRNSVCFPPWSTWVHLCQKSNSSNVMVETQQKRALSYPAACWCIATGTFSLKACGLSIPIYHGFGENPIFLGLIDLPMFGTWKRHACPCSQVQPQEFALHLLGKTGWVWGLPIQGVLKLCHPTFQNICSSKSQSLQIFTYFQILNTSKSFQNPSKCILHIYIYI